MRICYRVTVPFKFWAPSHEFSFSKCYIPTSRTNRPGHQDSSEPLHLVTDFLKKYSVYAQGEIHHDKGCSIYTAEPDSSSEKMTPLQKEQQRLFVGKSCILYLLNDETGSNLDLFDSNFHKSVRIEAKSVRDEVLEVAADLVPCTRCGTRELKPIVVRTGSAVVLDIPNSIEQPMINNQNYQATYNIKLPVSFTFNEAGEIDITGEETNQQQLNSFTVRTRNMPGHKFTASDHFTAVVMSQDQREWREVNCSPPETKDIT